MLKTYVAPEMEIFEIEMECVIATSGAVGISNEEADGGLEAL